MFNPILQRLADPIGILLSLPAIFIGFTVHEFAHAFVADRLGDPTPRSMGRVTLNPLVHIDIFGLLMLIFVGFGWAKPVMINPGNLKHPRSGHILVSLAGVTANLICAFVFFGLYIVLINASFAAEPVMVKGILPVLLNMVFLQLVLFFFNLIPVPPLDGFSAMRLLLFPKENRIFDFMQRYGIAIILLLSFAGVLSTYLNAAVDWLLGVIIQFYGLLGLY